MNLSLFPQSRIFSSKAKIERFSFDKKCLNGLEKAMDNPSIEAFRYDWNLGIVKITKNVRVAVTIILWGITAILSITNIVLSLVMNNKWILFSLYVSSLIPSFASFVTDILIIPVHSSLGTSLFTGLQRNVYVSLHIFSPQLYFTYYAS